MEAIFEEMHKPSLIPSSECEVSRRHGECLQRETGRERERERGGGVK